MMKHLATVAVMTLFMGLGAPYVSAQDDAEGETATELRTQFMMLNQHVCPSENMDEVMSMVETQIAPVLDQMEEAGEINDWGILTHAWGDEYNFNFFIVTDSQEDFTEAWSSMLERSSEKDPEWYNKWSPLCTLHKDNLYTMHDYR